MLRSIRIYLRLISIRMRGQMQYRLAFGLDVLSTGLVTFLGFGTLALVLARFENIGGWTIWEIAFLYGMVESAFGAMDLIFSGYDPPNFGRHVRLGSFDQMLLRPVNMTIQVLGSDFIIRRVGRILQGLLILGLAILNLPIHWTIGKMLYLPVVYLSQVLFFGALFMIGATITFWTVESIEVMNIFTYGGSDMMAYPMHIYPDPLRRFFTYILPAIFLNYYPALYFLGKPDPFHMPGYFHFLSPLVALTALLVALKFWGFGLRHYQSTGS